MKNNKVRYKAMKKSSPMVQYKRMLLGKHYCNGYRVSASDIVGVPIPIAIQEHIKEQLKEFQKKWSHAEVYVIRKGTK